MRLVTGFLIAIALVAGVAALGLWRGGERPEQTAEATPPPAAAGAQETASQETASQEAASQETASQESASQESVSQESASEAAFEPAAGDAAETRPRAEAEVAAAGAQGEEEPVFLGEIATSSIPQAETSGTQTPWSAAQNSVESGATGAATASLSSPSAPTPSAPSLAAPSAGLSSVAPGAPTTPPSGDAARLDAGVAKPPRPSAEQAAALGEARAALKETSDGLPSLAGPEGGAEAAPQPDASTARRPTFDIVRIDPTGSALVAGRAAPGSMVSVTLDGAVADEVRADRRGEFVALFDAARTPEPRGVSIDLIARTGDGDGVSAAAPVVVALPADPGQAPIIVRPDADGPVLMQPAAPVAEGSVSIDTVSYDPDGAVTISGRGAPGQTARVYLDGGFEAETSVDDAGDWRVALREEIAPDVYTLRVDQIDTGGGVSSRAETPFERAPVEDIVLSEGGVVVQPGNNLWRIATHVYGDGFKYLVIYGGNRDQIRDPDLIYPGQIFALPDAEAASQ